MILKTIKSRRYLCLQTRPNKKEMLKTFLTHNKLATIMKKSESIIIVFLWLKNSGNPIFLENGKTNIKNLKKLINSSGWVLKKTWKTILMNTKKNMNSRVMLKKRAAIHLFVKIFQQQPLTLQTLTIWFLCNVVLNLVPKSSNFNDMY